MNSSVLMALSRHDGGALVESADELLKEIVRDVVRYGEKGALTITLTISPNGKGARDEVVGSALKVSANVKAARPKRVQGEAFYWAAEDDSLTRTPPKEEDLLLRSIPSGVAKA